MKKKLENIYYTFPVQLVKLQIKKNLLILVLWLSLFLMVGGNMGTYFGVHYFFLDPEYLGKVSFWSFYIIGFSYGSFFLAWNTSIYILNSYRFPFLASLYKPFAKFIFNNSIIPVLFVIFYIVKIIQFQWYNEYAGQYSIIFYCFGFLLGIFSMLMLSMIYFQMTNNRLLNYHKLHKLKLEKKIKSIVVKYQSKEVKGMANTVDKTWRVDYYLSNYFNWKIVRNVEHYNLKILEKVFRQNHANAIVIQSLSISVLILMGALVEYPYFRIPTAASIFLLFSIIITIIGAVTYWLEEWRIVFMLVIISLTSQMMNWGWFSYENRAFGLDYSPAPAPYSIDVLDSLCSPRRYNKDIMNTQLILNKWRAKFGKSRLLRKPKLVLICVTGGGIRSSLWSHHVLRELDKELNGKLMKHTVLITGASGGMWGAALYRELYYQKQKNRSFDWHAPQYLEYSSRDLANPLAFTFLVNDIFIPWVNREVNGYTYKQDRGYIFEQQFIENTAGIMGMDLKYYQQPEKDAQIPMMFLTPMITNDSRFMIVSLQGVSYMMRPPFSNDGTGNYSLVDAVDFGALFSKHNAPNMRFVTALRMNASFPFIFPNIQLPTKPAIQLIDAAFRDNYGLENATRFATVFKDWIKANTSGITIISIRSFTTTEKVVDAVSHSVSDLILNPITPAFSIDYLQRYHHSEYNSFLKSKIGVDKLDIINFEYSPSKENEHASLGLHLTNKEKNDIINAINLRNNQKSIQKVKELVK